MLDTRLLLGAQGVQAPDAVQGYSKLAQLAQLKQAQQLQQMQLEEAERKRAASEGIGQALGGLDITDDNQVRGAMERMDPNARQGFLSYVIEQRKKIADADKDRATTRKTGTEAAAAQLELVGGLAGALAQRPDRRAWEASKQILQRAGIDPAALDVPDGADPVQHWTQLAQGSMSRKSQLDLEDKAEGRKLTARGQDITMRGQDMTDARTRELTQAQMAQTKALRETGMAQAAATRAAAADKRTVDVEMKLADDYRTQSKGWQETATAIGKAKKALETADTNAASALAAGTAFMKLLDPNSVVRESELGMALNASGWFDRAANVAQTLKSGRVMTPQQKKNLSDAADALFQEAAATQRQIDSAYTKRATDYGVNPQRVVVDLGQNAKPAGQPAKPKLGEVRDGYLYKGGNPADPSSWEKVKG
jgi:hypothetical protein